MIHASPPAQANHASAHPPCSLPGGVTPGAARHLPLGRRGPATVSSPPQALGPVGVVCGRARVCFYVIAFASPSLYSVFRPGQAQRFRV